MSYYSAKPVQLALMPSSLLVRVIGLAALTAVLVLLFLPVPVFLKCLLMGLVLLAAVHAYRRHAMLTAPDAIVRLSLNPESGLEMERRDGQTRLVTVREDSFVAAWLTVLNLRSVEGRQCHTLLLLADNVDPAAFRQLRVWLKWGREVPASARPESG